jgi:EAL domain-containing protein (putative c-di-GMP-specific phosphodiesterase class I)/GGDEF domain-containing protein
MSIRRQLAVGISLLMVVIMGGNLAINIWQLRTDLAKQLNARADETATTLALTMTHSAQSGDDASLRSMIDVMFDRGYYRHIRFEFTDGKGVVERVATELHSSGGPSWFKSVLPIPPAYAEAFVTQGWNQLGTLAVVMHEGPAYQQLWTLVKAELAWFALMTFILLYGLRLMLRWQLEPLKDIIAMAEKLSNHQFLHITQEPKSKELKSLVGAMNQLSDRLQASHIAHGDTVKRLQRDTYFDGLTDLHNRKGWDQFLQQWMTPDHFSCGWMMLIRIDNLAELNRKLGRTQVDELILQLAMLLKTFPTLNHEHACTARVGGEFWIFCPDPLDLPYTKRMEDVVIALNKLSLVQQYHVNLVSAGLPINDIIAPASVKHQLDLLIEKGSEQREPLTLGSVENHAVTNWVHWQQKFTHALNHDQIRLFGLPCLNADGSILQMEVHCRLQLDSGEPLMASYFWPMVERLNLSVQFDRAIVLKWLALMPEVEHDWVLNLSEKSLLNDDFRHWFLETVPKESFGKLILECSEYTLAHLEDKAVRWLHEFVAAGGRLGVDRVGTSGKSFGFLARYPISQGKIEKRFIHNVDQQQDHAFFVAAMVQVFHGQNALCIVEGVETQAEKSTLIDLGVDGVMGYGVERPQAL